jgi:hypothetical protein
VRNLAREYAAILQQQHAVLAILNRAGGGSELIRTSGAIKRRERKECRDRTQQ